MGLLRMATRTAVVAGTATAVSGRVAHRQANKYQQQADQQAAAQQQQQAAAQQQQQGYPPQQQGYAPQSPQDEQTAQLENLAKLHSQGILTDEEFSAAKAKVLGI
ncbi:MAG: hypothetical protein RLZ55_227 [Actinomycetota bacterium]